MKPNVEYFIERKVDGLHYYKRNKYGDSILNTFEIEKWEFDWATQNIKPDEKGKYHDYLSNRC